MPKMTSMYRSNTPVVLAGVERFGQKITNLAAVLGMHPGSPSFAADRCADRRRDEAPVQRLLDRIDEEPRSRGDG